MNPPIPRRPLMMQEHSGSLAAGDKRTISLLGYFSFFDGTGLTFRVQTGGTITVRPLTLFGDGDESGTITVANPTAGTLTYTIVTSSRSFNPSSLASAQNVTITGATATVPVSLAGASQVVGAAAHDAAVSGNPLLVGVEARASERAAVTEGDVVRLAADLAGKLIALPYANPENAWSYVPSAGGILNTTAAVTIAAAAGAGVRRYITSLQIASENLGAATEVAIRDGAGGAVLWRGQVRTSGLALSSFQFPVPLRGSVNTLLEVLTLTASVTGAVYVNVQGYTGA